MTYVSEGLALDPVFQSNIRNFANPTYTLDVRNKNLTSIREVAETRLLKGVITKSMISLWYLKC